MRDCNQCGKCCIHYGGNGLSASDEDLNWWENNRPDIFKLVKNKQIWFDPATILHQWKLVHGFASYQIKQDTHVKSTLIALRIADFTPRASMR